MEEEVIGIEENEFGLIGFLAGASEEELIGALKKKAVRTAVRKQLATGGKHGGGSRGELMNRLSQLGPEILNGLKSGRLQLVDTELFVARDAAALTNIKLLQDGDTKQFSTGSQIGMINGAKLEKGEVFLLDAIQLLYGLKTTYVNDCITWGQLEPKMRTGQFEMRANGKTIIPWTALDAFMPNMSQFSTTATSSYAFVQGDTTKRIGYHKLANPKLIKSQYGMEFNVEWAVASTALSCLKVVLIGSRVFTH